MADDKKILLEISFGNSLQNASDLKKEISSLATNEDYLNKSETERKAILQALNQELKDHETIVKKVIQAESMQQGSLEQMRVQSDAMILTQKKLGVENENDINLKKILVSESAKLKAEINEQQKAYGNYTAQVGHYEIIVDELRKKLDGLNSTYKNQVVQLNEVEKTQGKNSIGFKKITDELKVTGSAIQNTTSELKKMDTIGFKPTQTAAQKFSSGVSDSFQGLKSNFSAMALGSFIGQMGVQAFDLLKEGAQELFDGIKDSSISFKDSYEQAMKGVEFATKNFYKSIATGDWSNLLSNMAEAYDRGKKYEEVLQALEKHEQALGIVRAEENITMQQNLVNMRDHKLSIEDRIKAGNDYINQQKNLFDIESKSAEAYKKNELESLKLGNLTSEQKEKLFGLYFKLDGESANLRLEATKYNAAQELLNESATQYGNIIGKTLTTSDSQYGKLKEAVEITSKASTETKKFAEFIKLMQDNVDEKKMGLIGDTFKKSFDAISAFNENTKRAQTGLSQIEQEGLKQKQKIEQQKIELMQDGYAKQIALAKLAYKQVTDDSLSSDTDIEIAKNEMNIKLKKISEDQTKKEKDELNKRAKQNDAFWKQAEKEVDELAKKQKEEQEKKDANHLANQRKIWANEDNEEKQRAENHIKALEMQTQAEIELEQKLTNAKKDLRQNLFNIVQGLEQFELLRAGDNAEKQKEIKKKYALIDMGMSDAKIIGNTAQAVMKLASELGPLAPPFQAAVIAEGAVQLAIALAQYQQVMALASGGVVPGQGNRDSVPAYLTPGEVVLNQRQQAMIGKGAIYSTLASTGGQMGGHHFASGGISGRNAASPVIASTQNNQYLKSMFKNIKIYTSWTETKLADKYYSKINESRAF